MSTQAHFSTQLSNTMAASFLNGTAYDFTALSGSLYLGMLTAADMTAEISGGSYSRQVMAMVSTAGTNYSYNSSAISFTGVPAANITHWGVFSASSGSTTGLFYWANVNGSDVPTTLVTSDGDTVNVGSNYFTIYF